MIFELRQLKKNGKIHKFYSDENGQISVKLTDGSQKIRLTYFAREKGSAPTTVTMEELVPLLA